jgi:S-adenosylmethionine:tRNA ribosyltransferase-isomerase
MTPAGRLSCRSPAGASQTPCGALWGRRQATAATATAAASSAAAVSSAAVTGADALPARLDASSPAEARGLRRDQVRMMVARRFQGADDRDRLAGAACRIEHHRFDRLPELLGPGDMLVVNTSATLPASLDASGPGGEELRLHLSTALPLTALWSVELRLPAGPASRPYSGGAPGWRLRLGGGATAELLARQDGSSRLWVARIELPGGSLVEHLAAHGQPIRYPYVSDAWPIDAYQTVFADEPGSAEMPSAARAFTVEVVARLVTRGVEIAPVTLHTGVSSLEAGEAPYSEWFRVPFDTARRVNSIRRSGGRVIAVGTTVVRALESAADRTGAVHPAEGWTGVVVTPERGVHAVDGILTGWHEPRSSHLAMLEALAGADLVRHSYHAALEHGYLWHEFGDLHLILVREPAAGARELAGAGERTGMGTAAGGRELAR